MQQITLTRFYSPFGVHGKLSPMDGEPLYTLERPWKGNESKVSCIPEGTYTCRRIVSPTYGETFEVTDVEGRTHILFHEGNWIHNSLGCILLGEAMTIHNQHGLMVSSSRKARARFMDALEGIDEFQLHIIPFLPEYP